MNKAEVRGGGRGSSLCLSLRMKPSSLRPPQQALAGALQEDRGDLFFTTSVENREFPLYIGHYLGTRTHVHPHERHEDAL